MIPDILRERILELKCIPIEIEGKVIALQPKEESFKKFEEMYPEYKVISGPTLYILKNRKKNTPSCTTDFNDFSEVEDMSAMLWGWENFQTLDLSNFNTSRAKNMSMMFSGCQNLKTLNLSNFNTSKVKDMSSMFYGCQSLQTLDLSNFDTSNVENVYWMFEGCQNLKTVIINEEKNPKIIAVLQKLDHEVEIVEPTQKLSQSAVSECHAFS